MPHYPSECTRNALRWSKSPKFSWGSMPPDPPAHAHNTNATALGLIPDHSKFRGYSSEHVKKEILIHFCRCHPSMNIIIASSMFTLVTSTQWQKMMNNIWKLFFQRKQVPYILKISPQLDFISRPCLMWRQLNLRVARFQGRHLQRSARTHVYAASITSPFVCMYNVCAHTYYCCRPFIMRRDFEGSIYWDELAEIRSDISRAVGFWGTVRFRGNTVCISQ